MIKKRRQKLASVLGIDPSRIMACKSDPAGIDHLAGTANLTQIVGVRFSQSELSDIDKIAESEDRTRSGTIRAITMRYIRHV